MHPNLNVTIVFAVAMVRDLEFSSEINHYVSYSGFTPLHYAVVLGDEKVARYLLERGADPTLENNRGLRPGSYCTSERIKDLLEEYTAKVTAALHLRYR